MGTAWKCRHCGHVERDRTAYCGECYTGRTAAIEQRCADHINANRSHLSPFVRRAIAGTLPASDRTNGR